jgi:excisionase family DNA binding protein
MTTGKPIVNEPGFTPDQEFFDRPRSPEELAAFLDVTQKFVYEQIKKGRLRARKLSGRMIRIMPSDLKRWLDQASTVELTEV